MLNTNRINKLHYVAFHQKQSCFLSQLITSSNLIQEWHEIWEQWSFFMVLIWPRTTYSEISLINISSLTQHLSKYFSIVAIIRGPKVFGLTKHFGLIQCTEEMVQKMFSKSLHNGSIWEAPVSQFIEQDPHI